MKKNKNFLRLKFDKTNYSHKRFKQYISKNSNKLGGKLWGEN